MMHVPRTAIPSPSEPNLPADAAARGLPPRHAPARVWIVEDHRLFRELLADFLALTPTIDVAGTSEDPRPLFAQPKPDVDAVILDLNLGAVGGLKVLEQISAQRPDLPVIILSATATRHAVQRAMQLGARGYVDKATQLDEVVVALRAVLGGGIYVSERVRRVLIELAVGGRDTADVATIRETEVLTRLAGGAAVKEVANDLNLSKWAVYRIRTELRRKLALRNDRELAAYASRIGLAAATPLP